MKLEEQVISLEIAKKLKELGVFESSIYCWKINDVDGLTREPTIITSSGAIEYEIRGIAKIWSAYTASELAEMLPDYINENDYQGAKWLTCQKVGLWEVGYGVKATDISIEDKFLTNAFGKMLIYLKENNLLESPVKQ